MAKAARTPKAFAEDERGREREGDSERNDEARKRTEEKSISTAPNSI